MSSHSRQYATPPSSPRKVPKNLAADEEEELSESSMKSLSPLSSSSLLYRQNINLMDLEEEESTSTVGNQTDEGGGAPSHPNHSLSWDFDLDAALSIDIADVPDELEEEEGLEGPSTLVTEIEGKYGKEQGFYAMGSASVFVGKQMRKSPVKGGSLPGRRGAGGSLLILVLNDRRIRTIGCPLKLRELAGNVTELDLAGNELRDWTEVEAALRIMPDLSHCNLSRNAVTSLHKFSSSLQLPKMSSLVLNSTFIQWPTLQSLLSTMP